MRTVKDVEAYLGALARPFSPVEEQPGTFLLTSAAGVTIALRVDPPIVLARVVIGEVPTGTETQLFRTLLERNAASLVHTSYGLEGNSVVLSAALELENLDFNELEAALDEIDMTLASDVPSLRAPSSSTKADLPPATAL